MLLVISDETIDIQQTQGYLVNEYGSTKPTHREERTIVHQQEQARKDYQESWTPSASENQELVMQVYHV